MLQVQQIPIERLNPWEDNPRENDHAVTAVAKSIQKFGFNVPILCDQNMTIVAGHTRWKAAKTLALEVVPVIVVEMTDAQRRAFAVADNKLAELAKWDFPKLRDVLESLRSEDIEFESMGFSTEEMRRLLLDEEVDEDAIPALQDEQITQKGEMIILGEHRLLCGDSRDKNAVDFLVGDSKIDHVFGGPPYFNQREYAQWQKYDDYISDMSKIITNCLNIMRDGSVIAWNIANGCATHHDHVSHHSSLLEAVGMQYLDNIIWVKTGANYAIPRNFHILRNHQYYPALQWESILVFQKPGKMPKMTAEGAKYMSLYHTDVWEISAVTNQLKNYGHPAVCPVEIPYRSIQAYTGAKACVFEPFGGSGTTLIAAEKSGRRAFVIEQHPQYCDMIVRRWEQVTGRKAQRTTQRYEGKSA